MKEEINKLKDEYSERLTEILLNGIRNCNILVSGELNRLSIPTVELRDKETGDSLIELWTENQNDDLTHFAEYNFNPQIMENVRKEIFEYIVRNVNK